MLNRLQQKGHTLPSDWDHLKYLLHTPEARMAGAFSEEAAQDFYRKNAGAYTFGGDEALRNKNHIVTLLGYSKVQESGNRHTNWFPWNRFRDAIETIGYQCEWAEIGDIKRSDEARIFITWNEPTALELYQKDVVRPQDIVLQKLTSLGKGMEGVNWTADAREWSKRWEWPLYRTVEYLTDLGLNVFAFGCKTDPSLFPEKQRIVERLQDRIFWIPWGGTPFNWEEIVNAKPKMSDFSYDAAFVGSKWGKVGRGNIDAWDKYLTPLENSTELNFKKFGGIGEKMVSDEEMVEILRQAKLCPIVHAPSWQAERGVQDRFYTVFLSGRFGVCDNYGAADIFGDDILDIITEDKQEYYERSVYFCKNLDEQKPYIENIQRKIKQKHNFYVTWRRILSELPEISQDA